jgi:hypothetical protein
MERPRNYIMNEKGYRAMSQQIANISSYKLEEALDSLMAPAIRAINCCSDLYAVTVADALAAKAFDVRHRPSRSQSFENDAAEFLITRDIELGLRLKLNHDRNIAMCDQFLLSTAGADSATESAIYMNSQALVSMGDTVMAISPGRLFLARCEVEYSLGLFSKLREMIADKYERLATQQAAMHVKERPNVDYHVASQQAKQGIYTAIDRFSGERGALASYVQMWVYQALLDKTNLQHGAAIDIGSSGGGENDKRTAFLATHSTAAISIDSETIGDILAHDDSDGFANRHAEHTRALSAIHALRPALRAAGESLRYELNGVERRQLMRMN